MPGNQEKMMLHLPEEDLIHVLKNTSHLWEEMRGKSIFLSGATGFFGKWILESFLYINQKLNLGADVTALTRDKNKFIKNYPHLALNPVVDICEGCITDFVFPEKKYYAILHTAIDYKDNSIELYDSCVNATRHILDLTVISNAKKFLLTSSGAVYGRQPSTVTHISEEFCGGPDPLNTNSAYGLAKRTSEFLVAEFSRKNEFEAKIARGFAFIGPYLPLDKGSAVGNFIKDALLGKNILISGDGTPYRSYMYASDLMVWLWTILFNGVSCRPYNVGSEEEVTIYELASEVASVINKSLSIEILKEKDNSRPPERYIPSTSRARNELNLDICVPRKNAIEKMANWYKINHQIFEE